MLAAKLGEERSFNIGSPGERENVFVINEQSIANDQATLLYKDGRCILTNLQDDIKINRNVVTYSEQVALMSGDEITLGKTTLTFRERAIVEKLSKYRVEVLDGVDTDIGKIFELTKQRTVIGRDRKSDIPLTDQEISRTQCSLILRSGQFFLQHLSRTNSTILGKSPLSPGSERPIDPKDKIQISSHTFLQLVEKR